MMIAPSGPRLREVPCQTSPRAGQGNPP
jgi:hypothetical protein